MAFQNAARALLAAESNWGFEAGAWTPLLMGKDNDSVVMDPPNLWVKKFNGAV